MSMIRLHVTAEGQTEMAFVKHALSEYLMVNRNISANARAVLTSKDNKLHIEHRGGLVTYEKARRDIITWMKEDNHPECRFSTMFDYYRLPPDFPGYMQAMRFDDPYERINCIEEAFREDISDLRFIPYIQLHEFEALIFADPDKLDWEYLEHGRQIGKLKEMAMNINPELINNDPETAPSKRILNLIPEYDKVTAGVSVVMHIGMNTLLDRCKHFADWVNTLLHL